LKVINKQKLSKEIKSLFLEMKESDFQAVSEQEFNEKLKLILNNENHSLVQAGNQFVSVLMSDLRGFTALLEKASPSLIIELLNEYFSVMVEIIDRHGGYIDKFIGDSIFALFDATSSSRNGILDVLICAIEMQIAMDKVNRKAREVGIDNIYMGIGINTGEVLASVLGSDIYREYTVIGNNVNVASRVEAYTLRGQILISENTYRYTKDDIEIGEVNVVKAKGMRTPLKLYELKAVTHPERLELPRREKRRAPRIGIKIPFSYHLLDGKNVLHEEFQGEIVDISYGGVLIVVDEMLEAFSDLKLILSLTPFSDEPLEIYAKTLYAKDNDGGVKAGLEFTIIDNEASEAVKNFVGSLM